MKERRKSAGSGSASGSGRRKATRSYAINNSGRNYQNGNGEKEEVIPNNDFTDHLPDRCITQEQLNRLSQCCPCPGAENYQPTCICVQQTPRIVCRKNIVWVQKLNYEPSVVNTTKIVMVPKVVKIERAVRVPEVVWTEGYVNVPRIEKKRSCFSTHEVKYVAKTVTTPQEICTRFLCRPKPQTLCIPPPTDYCCYSLDSMCNLPGGDMCPPSLPGYPPQNAWGGGWPGDAGPPGWGGGWHGSPGWGGGWPGYPPGSGGGWPWPYPCPDPSPGQCPPCPNPCPPCPNPCPHCPPQCPPCPNPCPPCPNPCPPCPDECPSCPNPPNPPIYYSGQEPHFGPNTWPPLDAPKCQDQTPYPLPGARFRGTATGYNVPRIYGGFYRRKFY